MILCLLSVAPYLREVQHIWWICLTSTECSPETKYLYICKSPLKNCLRLSHPAVAEDMNFHCLWCIHGIVVSYRNVSHEMCPARFGSVCLSVQLGCNRWSMYRRSSLSLTLIRLNGWTGWLVSTGRLYLYRATYTKVLWDTNINMCFCFLVCIKTCCRINLLCFQWN